jgi:hypothetical protein
VSRYPSPDITLERIGDLVDVHRERLLGAATG